MASRLTYKICSLAAMLGWSFGSALAVQTPDINNISPTIVSLDYCADQYVLTLAKRSVIMALSSEAGRNYSYYREKATGIPTIKGTISEVVFYQPDIVLESYNVAPRLKQFTDRLDIKLLSLNYGFDQEVIYKNLSALGAALGEAEKAEQLITQAQREILTLQQAPKTSLTAVYLTPSGYTAGSGTFVDTIIRMAGFQTYASKHDLKGWLTLPVELIVMDPPDIVITSFYDTNLVSQSNWSHARHDRIKGMLTSIPSIDLPGSMLACGGLFFVEAVKAIRAQADTLALYSGNKGAQK